MYDICSSIYFIAFQFLGKTLTALMTYGDPLDFSEARRPTCVARAVGFWRFSNGGGARKNRL